MIHNRQFVIIFIHSRVSICLILFKHFKPIKQYSVIKALIKMSVIIFILLSYFSIVNSQNNCTGSFVSNAFTLTWIIKNSSTTFNLTTKLASRKKRNELSMPINGISNRYTAFAFSKDKNMVDRKLLERLIFII